MKGHVLSCVSHANVIYGDCFITSLLLLFTSCGRLSSELYKHVFRLLLALFSNIMDTVKTVKVFYVQTLRQFYGMTVTVY